ncbi:2-oxoglutarate (2OG) and Fe(II)-dependent oxygenase superfamily protein [Artemisia annua]|uniref:2-oxoglutarate (2OG) and Fe(II)-dependent oxygenase superfamily protein n=1 Tax=Artemisia annua TaxID=35608 RepID=A0A2U1NRA0_ARTAN|nr:2-oxoglutarate (2OG) and Fe(II)-dependent oxygenase superfamily protein [Artemisia annua]
MIQIAKNYFKLPEEEHLKSYSDDPNKTIRLSTSFNIRTEKVKNWRDYLRLQCYPLEDYVHEWPENPESFKEHVSEYCASVSGLALELIEAISESLGLGRDYISAQLGKHAQHIALNYYPPCPQPDLTYGLPGHSDLNLITILLQADEVSGLQVSKDGKWISVDPVPNTFIINVGDQIQLQKKDYFKLPEEEHLKSYSDDPNKTIRLSTSFNIRTEKVKNWRDYLRLQCYPLEDYVHEWPENPESFKEHVSEYCASVSGLARELIEAISESLGLGRDYISEQLGKHAQHIALNYYPPCPQPDLTYGLPGHSDLNLITILLQADDVSGLQVSKDGKWISVDPVPNTFIINVGDQIQVLSNDKYKSVLHRAVVNCDKERISIPLFYCPSKDAIIEPAPMLVTDDHPAVYRQFKYGEYHETFWDRGLATENCLDMFMAGLKSD